MMKLIKRCVFTTALIGMIVVMAASAVFAQTEETPQIETKKRGQTGMKFLAMSVDARSQGMGNAVTADMTSGAVALFYNPASMAWSDAAFDVAIGHTQWIADINYNVGAAAWSPGNGQYGVFGISVMAVDYGSDFIGTVRSSVDAGYEDTNTFGPSAYSVGIGYAKTLSDRFSFGAQAKIVGEDLGAAVISGSASSPEYQENKKSNFAMDFGIIYRTGFKSLNFAMTARNFAGEVQYQEENFELPLTFRIGVSMDLIDFTSMDPGQHSLLLAIDTERPRDFDEQIKLGAEYTFMQLLSLRAGYTTPTDEESISLGAGLHKNFDSFGFALDYAYTSFGTFDNVNRFMVRLLF